MEAVERYRRGLMGAEPEKTGRRIDGRTARAQRTSQAVVDALLSLIEDGDLRPTGPRIAERAGVSLRSVFQHFNDLESLFAALGSREIERLSELTHRLPTDQPLEARIEAFVAQRSRILEAISPVRRASLLQEPFSAELRQTRDAIFTLARAEVARLFRAELAAAGADREILLDALDAVSSWSFWDALRSHQGLEPAAAAAVLGRVLRRLLQA